MTNKNLQPSQPIVIAGDNVIRFKENKLVNFLLDEATAGRMCDMNRLATIDATQEDRVQFAQLIGYSVSGWCDLSYVDNKVYRRIYNKYKKVQRRWRSKK
jgi:hypothetical protein